MDSTSALVIVVKALEPLNGEERQWVLQSAAARWGANFLGPPPGASTPPGAGNSPPTMNSAVRGDAQAAIAKKDSRSFMRIKKPNTDVQRVACLVYYLTHTEGKPAFTSKEIGQAHVDSGGSKINMTRALDNATRANKYISNRGPKEKQLTPLGEDIVEALPDQTLVKGAEFSAKRPKGRTRKKTKKV